jgi:hypothetical protein
MTRRARAKAFNHEDRKEKAAEDAKKNAKHGRLFLLAAFFAFFAVRSSSASLAQNSGALLNLPSP